MATILAEANNDTQKVKADDIFGNKYKKELEETIFKDFIDLIALVIRVAGIITVMAMYVWCIALLIVIVSIPLYWLAIKSGKATCETNRTVTKLKRKYEYIGEWY